MLSTSNHFQASKWPKLSKCSKECKTLVRIKTWCS